MSVQEKLVSDEADRAVLKKDQRSVAVVAKFVDGVAAGWVFSVPASAAVALDIQKSLIRRDGAQYSCWTQGWSFNFTEGTVFHHGTAGLMVQVDDADPAEGVPGRVDFTVYVLYSGGWGKAASYTCTQAEFVGLLQSGELVYRSGVVDLAVVHGALASEEQPSSGGEGEPVSISRALKVYDVRVGPAVATAILTGAGVLREVSRWSESGDKEQRFKVFTEAGSFFGYDKVFRDFEEGQPLYYLERFKSLADLIARFMAGGTALSVWADCNASFSGGGSVTTLYKWQHIGSEEWYTDRVALFRKAFSIPVAHSLNLVVANEMHERTFATFWEYSERHELLARYNAVVKSPLDDLNLDDMEFVRQVVSWN